MLSYSISILFPIILSYWFYWTYTKKPYSITYIALYWRDEHGINPGKANSNIMFSLVFL